MKFILVAVGAFTLLSSSASAQERWTKVAQLGPDEASSVFIGENSIEKNGSERQYWTKFPGESGIKYHLRLIISECSSRKFKFLQIMAYYKDGGVQAVKGGPEWTYVPPDSVMEAIHDYACSK